MSELDFKIFSDVCEKQGVDLHPLIAEPEEPISVCSRFVYFAPSQLLEAVSISGILLREDRNTRLADRLIRPDEQLNQSKPASILANIVNGSIEPVESTEDLPIMAEGADVCEAADYNFLSFINRLREENPTGQIVGDSEPTLLRKTSVGEIKSALSVRELVVDGIPYPAGSIFSIKLRRDEMGIEIPDQVEDISMHEIEGLSFMRLSMFALDPKERRNNFTAMEFEPGSRGGDSELDTLTMAEIGDIAREAYDSAIPLGDYVSAA